jgi:hypothetical protein
MPLCATCPPRGTPTVIPTEQIVASCPDVNDPENTHIDWCEWYALDVGQRPGERALNWFSEPCLGGITGISLWDNPGTPRTMPVQFSGQCVDYYWLWNCAERHCAFYQPRTNPSVELELLSIGPTCYELNQWARGKASDMQVYVDLEALDCQCTEAKVRTFFASHDINDPKYRRPVVWKMSKTPGVSVNSPPVCMLRFRNAVEPDGDLVLDMCNYIPNSASPYLVRATLLRYEEDVPGASCTSWTALNQTFITDCARADSLCNGADWCRSPTCARQGRAKRYSPPDVQVGNCNFTGTCGWCTRNYEVFSSRRRGGPQTGGPSGLTVRGGQCTRDDCDSWFVSPFDPPGIGAGEPPPGPGAPTPTPTPTLAACLQHLPWLFTRPSPTPGPDTPSATPGTHTPSSACPGCNLCENCGQGAPATGTPEVCCGTPDPRTPTPPNSTPCARCAILQGHEQLYTPVAECCGAVLPTATPLFTAVATCAPGQTATLAPAYTPMTPTPTGTITPPCCEVTSLERWEYNEFGCQRCTQRDAYLNFAVQSPPITCPLGPRYMVSLEVYACCSLMLCATRCPTGWDGWAFGYNAAGHQIGSWMLCATQLPTGKWKLTMADPPGCAFDDHNLPVRWSVRLDNPDLKPYRAIVTYGCCSGATCPGVFTTPTGTPATPTPPPATVTCTP